MKDEIYGRELGWMELVSKALFVFSKNIKGILLVVVVVFLPVSLLESVLLERINAISSFLNSVEMAGTLLDEAGIMQVFRQTMASMLMAMAISLFLHPVGTIAIAKLAKQLIDGEEISAKKALMEALALEPMIILSGFIYGVIVFIASLVVIPGIWLSVLWGLYVFCVGLGGRKGWNVLAHSAELVRGRWWRTLGYLCVLQLVMLLWNSVFELIFVFGGDNLGTNLLYRFLSYFSFAFYSVAMALLFINREAQHQGWKFFGKEKEMNMDGIE